MFADHMDLRVLGGFSSGFLMNLALCDAMVESWCTGLGNRPRAEIVAGLASSYPQPTQKPRQQQ